MLDINIIENQTPTNRIVMNLYMLIRKNAKTMICEEGVCSIYYETCFSCSSFAVFCVCFVFRVYVLYDF